MAVTEYIGPLVGPIFADPAEWTPTRSYEALTIVLNEGNSYTARQDVPIGIQITNNDYWLETGNYNAQVEAYRQEVLTYTNNIKNLEYKTPYVTPEMFGAIGDGTTNDTNAFKQALQTNMPILLGEKTYVISEPLYIDISKQSIIGISSKSVIKAAGPMIKVIEFYSSVDFYTRQLCNGANGNFYVDGNSSIIGVQFGDSETGFNGPVFNQFFRNITVRNAQSAFVIGSHVYKCTMMNLVADSNLTWSLRTTTSDVRPGESECNDTGENLLFIDCAFYVGSIYLTQSVHFICCAIHYNDQNTLTVNLFDKNTNTRVPTEITASHFFKHNATFTNCHFETLFVTKNHDYIFFSYYDSHVVFDGCEFLVTPTSALFNCKCLFFADQFCEIRVTNALMPAFLGRITKTAKLSEGAVYFNGINYNSRSFYYGGVQAGNIKVGPTAFDNKLQVWNENPSAVFDGLYKNGHIQIRKCMNYTMIGSFIDVGTHDTFIVNGTPSITTLTEEPNSNTPTDPTLIRLPINSSSQNSCVAFYDNTNNPIPFTENNENVFQLVLNKNYNAYHIPHNAIKVFFGIVVSINALQTAYLYNLDIDVSNMTLALL